MIAEGTPPDRFALEHGHYDVDLPFWAGLADELGGPVLDLGAAVGRVTIPLARSGHDVWALDGSVGMIDGLRTALAAETTETRARVQSVVADLRTFALDRTFPLVILPMNTLQALLTRDDQLACLRRIAEHVMADGVFAFDVVMSDLRALATTLGERHAGPAWRDPATGTLLIHSAWFDAVDVTSGTASFTASIDEVDPQGATRTHLRAHTVHLFSPTELWELLHEAGFVVQAVYGDFDRRPLDDDAERQVYRCGVRK